MGRNLRLATVFRTAKFSKYLLILFTEEMVLIRKIHYNFIKIFACHAKDLLLMTSGQDDFTRPAIFNSR